MLIKYKNNLFSIKPQTTVITPNYKLGIIENPIHLKLFKSKDTEVSYPTKILINTHTNEYAAYSNEALRTINERECLVVGNFRSAYIVTFGDDHTSAFKHFDKIRFINDSTFICTYIDGEETQYYLYDFLEKKQISKSFDFLEHFENNTFTAITSITDTEEIICLIDEFGKIVSPLYDTVNQEYHDPSTDIETLKYKLFDQLIDRNKTFKQYSYDLSKINWIPKK